MAQLTPQQEAELQAAFYSAFAIWLPAAQAAALAAYDRFGSAPNPAAVNATSRVWQEQVQRIMADRLEPVAEESYTAEVAGVAGAAVFTMGALFMAGAATATFAFLAAQVSEVQAHLSGIIRNKTLADAAAAVAAYLNPANPHWLSKSQQFAQTEGDRWVQAATLAAGVATERADGASREKVWMSRDDALVRPAHVAADGQRRPLLRPFIVAGFPMMYPADPAAPVELVANCRCWMRIVPAEVSRAR